MDGVAFISDSRFSTLRRTVLRCPSRLPSTLRSIVNVWSSDETEAVFSSGVSIALAPSTDVPPTARFFTFDGSFSMARADTGSSRARRPSSLIADCSDSI